MQQKIRQMLYLIFGISISVTMILVSCKKKTDNEVYCQYIYKNNSNYNINLKVYNSIKEVIGHYNISINDSIIIELHGDGGVGPFQYELIEAEQGDSVVVTFANQRYISYIKGEGLLYEKEYEKIRFNSIKYLLKYSFTNEDYDNAFVLK